MACSPHAYVRGNTRKFYEWLGEVKRGSVPDGPAIWICGDCHVGNLGPVADADGRLEVEVRDLDQTVIGNPAHDLVRLGLSLCTAARSSNLPGVTAAAIVEQMIVGYEEVLVGRSARAARQEPNAIRQVLRRASKRRWKHLLTERVEDTKPHIPIGQRFWPLSQRERRAVDALCATEALRALVTSLSCRKDDAAVDVVDAAYWVKGCSSLGRLRIAVLARVESSSLEDGQLCLIDIKEATRACAPRYGDARMPKVDAERVVAGALHLSPFLGKRMRAARLLGRSVFVR